MEELSSLREQNWKLQKKVQDMEVEKHVKEVSRGQFHQYYTRGFFVQKFWEKIFCAWSKGYTFYWLKENKPNCTNKMLVILTPGVFFLFIYNTHYLF